MSGEIQIEDFGEMSELITQLQAVQAQANTLCAYVDTWVCNDEGFTPSEVCALSPLAGALPSISGFFWNANATFTATISDLIDAVAKTMQDYQRQEEITVTSLAVLTGRMELSGSGGRPGVPPAG